MTKNIAIVTGANKGLGYAIVEALCKKYDGKVYLTSRDVARGLKACEELKKNGLSPKFFKLDVTDDHSIKNFITHIRKQNEEIDILVNNAGVLFLNEASQPEEKLNQVEQTMKVNFFSLVNFTESVLPLFKNGGKIVNVSSSSGHLSRIPSEKLRNSLAQISDLEDLKELMSSYVEAVKGNREMEEVWGKSPYVVSKVGVNAYTFILHRRLNSKGILVNSVHPGYVMSDMTRGAGTVSPAAAAELPAALALRPPAGGLYVWHDGSHVPWDGPDPRAYIDKKVL